MIRHESQQTDYDDERLEPLVSEDHVYRKLKKLVDFNELTKPLAELFCQDNGAPSHAIESGFRHYCCNTGKTFQIDRPSVTLKKISWLVGSVVMD